MSFPSPHPATPLVSQQGQQQRKTCMQLMADKFTTFRQSLAGRSPMLDAPSKPTLATPLRLYSSDRHCANSDKFFGDTTPSDPNEVLRLMGIDDHDAILPLWHEGGFYCRRVRLVFRGRKGVWSTSAWSGVIALHSLFEEGTNIPGLAKKEIVEQMADKNGVFFPLNRLTPQSTEEVRKVAFETTAVACAIGGAWAFAWKGQLYDCSGRTAYKYGMDLPSHLHEIRKLDSGIILDGNYYVISVWRTLVSWLVALLSIGAVIWQITFDEKQGLSGVLESIGNVILLLGLLGFFVMKHVQGAVDVMRLLLGYSRQKERKLTKKQVLCLANFEGLSASSNGVNMSFSNAMFVSGWAEHTNPVKARNLTASGWLVFDRFAVAPSGLRFRVRKVGGLLQVTRDCVESVEEATGILYPDALVGGNQSGA